MKSIILACWLFCADCPPEPNFNPALMYKQQVGYNREIRTCCLENGLVRPMYYFKLSGFPPHQVIKSSARDFFIYDEDAVETDSFGKATIIAFVKNNHTVPDLLDMEFTVESEKIDFRVITRDPQ